MTDRAMYLPAMLALRNGAKVFDVSYNGAALITFPSFHAIWALALVYIHRGNGWASVAVATLNTVVLLSVLSEGGHYLIDLIFGVFVAVAAIVVVPIVMPRLPESC
jgi:membrane-associated phospholipid phosphatase